MVNEETSNTVLEMTDNSMLEEPEIKNTEIKQTEQNLSKRQLKKLKKTEKWIQRKSEKR